MFSWIKNKFKMNEQTKLSGLVRGIMSAVQSASDIAGQQHFDLISNYFDVEEDGTLIPKIIRIKLNDDKYLDVPLICMVNPSSYKMSKMQVSMFVKLKPGEAKAAIEKGVDESKASRNSCLVEFGHSNSKNAVKIKMCFLSNESEPESIARMIEELQNNYEVPVSSPNKNLPIWTPSKCHEHGKILRNKTKNVDTDNDSDIINDNDLTDV